MENTVLEVRADALARAATDKGSLSRTDAPTGNVRYDTPVPLVFDFPEEPVPLRVSGELAALCEEDGVLTAHLCKRLTGRRAVRWETCPPAHRAEAVLCGAMALAGTERDAIALAITYVRADEREEVARRVFSRKELEKGVSHVLSKFAPFAKMLAERRAGAAQSLASLRFPYGAVREGQHDFITEAYRTIRRGGHLFVEAPTGIGKTMAAIFPALRAVGKGLASRVFYFTAKGVTGLAALAAARLLSEQSPSLRCAMITAKEKCCPMAGEKDAFVSGCRSCPLSDGYYGRAPQAVMALVREHRIYDRDLVAEYARRYHVCPYELSLDVSMYCDLIISDYNYLFDLQVYFRRYFEKPDGASVFLFDEAHNLPDRLREMYSATLTRSAVLRAKDACGGVFSSLLPILERIDEALLEAADASEENVSLLPDGTRATAALFPGETIAFPGAGALLEALASFTADAAKLFRPLPPREIPKPLDAFHGTAREMLATARVYSRRFTTFIESREKEGKERAVRVRLLCLDPSELVRERLEYGRASVFFSATLSPQDYFADLLGCGRDFTELSLPSPYDKENVLVVGMDALSTRYEDREGTLGRVCRAVYATVLGRRGNYMVFFPSYRYMQDAAEMFSRLYPKVKIAVQSAEMTAAAREQFLSQFSTESTDTLVGFCVLGGIFSEGVDLAGERLIGAVIVGVGLPGVSSELNILSEYFERTREHGFDYAYVYPGMTKVAQAGGRVIRGEDDRGVIVLIDSRFAEEPYKSLLPKHWHHIVYTGDERSLAALVRRFWRGGEVLP